MSKQQKSLNSSAGNKQEVKIVDNIPGVEYANAMQINHSREEFQLIFFNISGLSGKVAGKIVTSPSHYKRILLAMEDNLKKYEEKFGEIKEAGRIDSQEIGFAAK